MLSLGDKCIKFLFYEFYKVFYGFLFFCFFKGKRVYFKFLDYFNLDKMIKELVDIEVL